jgi:putative intracellular protease/amidase
VFGDATDKLKSRGCLYESKDVVEDGNIITVSGPPVAKQFAEALVKALLKKKKP